MLDNNMMRKSCALVAVLLLRLIARCDGFSSQLLLKQRARLIETPRAADPCTIMNMAKKRRRRKQTPSPSADEDSIMSSSDELPDFDFDDGIEEPTLKSSAPLERSTPVKPIGQVTVDELISDRSLESKMKFDEPEMELPNLGDFRDAPSDLGTPKMGKKRARQEARRAAAIAEKEEEQSDILSSLPPFPFVGELVKDGNLDPVKVLEAGAWIGIFLLVLWEAYINSPFFERAAPISPVVY